MELIQLEDHLRLNIPEIDAQHEKLIELVNRLHEALLGGADKAVRDSLLSQLLKGMQSHCAYEEELMLRYGYPEYQAHKSEHDRLKRNLVDLIERYRNGELVLSIAVVMEFKCWATIHIEKSDKPLGAFLIDQKGVEPVRD
jgi:hemerythrin